MRLPFPGLRWRDLYAQERASGQRPHGELMKIKRRYDFLQRLKANREIDRCRKMSHDELMAYLQAKYAEEK